MNCLKVNIKNLETAQKLETIVSLFDNNIEMIALKDEMDKQTKDDKYKNAIATCFNKINYQVIEIGNIYPETDHIVDLIAFKENDNDIVLIQYKNDDKNLSKNDSITKQDLINTETEMMKFLEQYMEVSPLKPNDKIFIRICVSHKNMLTEEAQKYCKQSYKIRYIESGRINPNYSSTNELKSYFKL